MRLRKRSSDLRPAVERLAHLLVSQRPCTRVELAAGLRARRRVGEPSTACAPAREALGCREGTLVSGVEMQLLQEATEAAAQHAPLAELDGRGFRRLVLRLELPPQRLAARPKPPAHVVHVGSEALLLSHEPFVWLDGGRVDPRAAQARVRGERVRFLSGEEVASARHRPFVDLLRRRRCAGGHDVSERAADLLKRTPCWLGRLAAHESSW